MTWNFDLAQMPIDESVLVFLAEELIGSRIHAAKKVTVANGHLMTVGCYFASDAPQILAWCLMIDDPKEAIA